MKTTVTAALALLGLGLALGAAPARAHITASPDKGPAGSFYVGVLRVGHGCEGSATVAVSVEIPAEVLSAKPQPKPGWTLSLTREPLPRPVRGEGGREVRDRVARIVWRGGPLPDDQFDTFGLMLRLPARAGPLYLPVVQTCETGQARWADIPAPGQAWHDLPRPAPVIDLTPAGPDPMAGMRH